MCIVSAGLGVSSSVCAGSFWPIKTQVSSVPCNPNMPLSLQRTGVGLDHFTLAFLFRKSLIPLCSYSAFELSRILSSRCMHEVEMKEKEQERKRGWDEERVVGQ
jgi:hypothetical protein